MSARVVLAGGLHLLSRRRTLYATERGSLVKMPLPAFWKSLRKGEIRKNAYPSSSAWYLTHSHAFLQWA